MVNEVAVYVLNGSVKIGLSSHSEVDGDEYKERMHATRRAIVRAAAEIGKHFTT